MFALKVPSPVNAEPETVRMFATVEAAKFYYEQEFTGVWLGVGCPYWITDERTPVVLDDEDIVDVFRDNNEPW